MWQVKASIYKIEEAQQILPYLDQCEVSIVGRSYNILLQYFLNENHAQPFQGYFFHDRMFHLYKWTAALPLEHINHKVGLVVGLVCFVIVSVVSHCCGCCSCCFGSGSTAVHRVLLLLIFVIFWEIE